MTTNTSIPERETSTLSLDRVYENESPLSKAIQETAPDIGINPNWLQFPHVFHPKTDSDGDRYITDLNNIIRYYLGDGVVTVAPQQVEREKIISETEREMSIDSVMYEVVHGAGSPFGPSSQFETISRK